MGTWSTPARHRYKRTRTLANPTLYPYNAWVEIGICISTTCQWKLLLKRHSNCQPCDSKSGYISTTSRHLPLQRTVLLLCTETRLRETETLRQFLSWWRVLLHVGRWSHFEHFERNNRNSNPLHRWKHPPGTSSQQKSLEHANIPSDETSISEDCIRNALPMDTLLKK